MLPNLIQVNKEIIFSGVFTFETIEPILKKWAEVKKNKFLYEEVIINCEQVMKGDSSFIALLIEMRRWSHYEGLVWNLVNLPKIIQASLVTYGVADFLKTIEFK